MIFAYRCVLAAGQVLAITVLVFRRRLTTLVKARFSSSVGVPKCCHPFSIMSEIRGIDAALTNVRVVSVVPGNFSITAHGRILIILTIQILSYEPSAQTCLPVDQCPYAPTARVTQVDLVFSDLRTVLSCWRVMDDRCVG